MNFKIYKCNVYTALIYRVIIIMFILTLSRIGFYLFNYNLYEDIGFTDFTYMLYGGLKFDISAVIYFNLLIIVLHAIPFKIRYNKIYQNIVKYLYFLFNGFIILINNADIIYYRFTLKRTTSTIFAEFQNEGQMFKLIMSFLVDYWYITLFTIFLMYLMVFLYKRVKLKQPTLKQPLYHIGASTVLLALIGGLCLAGMRGGFRHSTRPITLSNANKFTNSPNQRAIVLNTPFSILRTISKKSLVKRNYFNDNELNNYYSTQKKVANNKILIDSTNVKQNVVLIILESFSKEHFGFLNKDIKNYKGYTPFLDSICNYSYVVQNSYANGRKSIDALPSVLASVPQIVEPFVLSHYSGNSVSSIANILKTKGYYSAFFHGAPNGSMGFQSFIKQAGFDNYYGKTEYNNDEDYDGMWGIWDEPFFQFYADKMNTFKQPFVTSIFSVSSHHPYKLPEKYNGKFKKGNLPVQHCISYTDNALRNFFNKAKKMDWYKNTLFVITADHSIRPYLEKYKTSFNSFSVPIIFYKPNSSLIKNDYDNVVQQIDILPSVLSLLGYDKEFVSFGNNIFENKERYAVNYIGGLYQILDSKYILQFDGEKVVGFYNLKKDYFMKDNLKGKLPQIEKKYSDKLKAFVQDYANRMIENRLKVKK